MLLLVTQPYVLTIGFIVILSMLLLILLSVNNQSFDRNQKIRFILLFLTVSTITGMDIATNLIDNAKNNALLPLDYFCNFIGFGLSPLPMLLISRILYKGKEPKFISLIYLAYVIVLAFLIGFKKLFELTPDTFEYIRHPSYFYFYVPVMILSFTYLLINSIRIALVMFMRGTIVLFTVYALLISGLVIQIIKASVHVNCLIIAIVSIIYYIYVSSMWAQMDGLTGLFSHYSFLQAIKNIKPNTTVIVMDADDFKMINDKYGHVEGDRCLRLISKEIKLIFGKFGACYRLGGDEFAVIINPKKECDIQKRIELFNNRIKMHQSNTICPNVSIGYAVFDKNKMTDELLELADKNMYINKAIQKAKNDKNNTKKSVE